MSFSIQQGLFQFDLIDHFAVLGVSIDADCQNIRQRYLKIAYKLHPDTCKNKVNAERELANQLLSKLVNPAYGHLSHDSSRAEFRLILAQIGKGMAQEISKMTLGSEPAQKLAKASANYELAYQKLLQSLVIDQYTALENTYQKIAQLSELNMVYLMLTEGQGNKKTAKIAVGQQASNTIDSAVSPLKTKESTQEVYIRRAQEFLDKDNPTQAMRELRDALRAVPDDSVCHALLGLAYLRQNQLSMARVHINQAWKASPKNPTVIQSKRELDKVIHPNIEIHGKKDSSERAKEGGFWSRFGGKKKP